MPHKKRIHVFISGRVQGVFFRVNTQNKARELGLTGWVQNLTDGRVEAVFEGEEEKIKEMLGWIKNSPFPAKVKSIEIEEESFKGEFNNFEIRY